MCDETRETARGPGCRLPAEWEAQARVWVSRPHNPDTWPGCLEQAIGQFDEFVTRLQERVEVRDTQKLGIPTDDAWIRDFGPIFVTRPSRASRVARPESEGKKSVAPLDPRPATRDSRPPRFAALDFRFNSWGGKYPPWDRDDAVAGAIARHLDIPLQVHDHVLEGGAIDGNGAGMILTTEAGMLGPGRNPGLDRSQSEQLLRDALGASHVIWLSGGVQGDDTGHVDQIARFISSTTIAAVRAPRGHPDHDVLKRNWGLLKEERDQDGGAIDLVALPVPRPLTYPYPPDSCYDVCRGQLPASYANFLISNGAVFLPVFGQPSDDEAVRVLDRAMPRHTVVPVRSEHLLVGLGTIHCLTMHQPG